MRKKGYAGSVVIWILVMVMMLGSSLLEGLFPASAKVEYDTHMETQGYQTDVAVGEDNSYTITETIDVYMRSERHGIYRYVPVKGYSQTYMEDGKTRNIPYYADVELLNCSVPVSVSRENGFYVMRLGSADRTVRGEQTYRLTYRLTPRFQSDDFTAAYYNLLPITWQNRIPEGSGFTVKFPKDFDHEKLHLYYGAYGSVRNAEEVLDLSWQGNTLTGRLNQKLEFLSGVTMYADMGEGYFTGTHTIGKIQYVVFAIGAAVLLVNILLFLFFGKDEPIIPSVQFQPPSGLDSAAVGYIIDGSIQDKDILSLIIYWADKGYLRMEMEKKNKLYFVKTDTPLSSEEPAYAQTLYNCIFKKGSRVSVNSLKYKCVDAITASKGQLKKYMKDRGGIYTMASRAARILSTLLGILPVTAFVVLVSSVSKLSAFRILFYAVDVLLLVVGICVFNSIVDNWYARTDGKRKSMAVFGLGLSMVSIGTLTGSYVMQILQGEVFNFSPALVMAAASSGISVILAGFMKRRTDKCVEWMGYLAGLRDFIETAELDRLKMLAEENPQWFYHILPYTYVFGLSDIFAKRLEGLAIPAPEWYSTYVPGYHGWNYYHFHRTFMKNMDTVSRSLTIAEPPKNTGSGGSSGGGFGSGGYSGGGFSGGGFGGGGGGSW